MKVIRYHVARNTDMDALVREVNQYIDAGWQPSGGLLSMAAGAAANAPPAAPYAAEYAQALVLYER